MKLINKILPHSVKIPTIKVSTYNLDDFTVFFVSESSIPITMFEILDANKSVLVEGVKEFYLTLVFELLKESKFIAMSQLIDGNLRRLENRDVLFEKLRKKYNLQIEITKNCDSNLLPIVGDREYFIHVMGTSYPEWLMEVMQFCGAYITNIIYGSTSLQTNWPEAILKKNNLFAKWYWNDIESTGLAMLAKESSPIIWTDNFHVHFIVQRIHMEQIKNMIIDLAKQKSMNIKVI